MDAYVEMRKRLLQKTPTTKVEFPPPIVFRKCLIETKRLTRGLTRALIAIARSSGRKYPAAKGTKAQREIKQAKQRLLESLMLVTNTLYFVRQTTFSSASGTIV